MSDATTIAMNFPRRDARDKLCGRTRYTIDRARPGMLHAALARANVPSARIIRIDTGAARRMPGVRAIITGADAPFRHAAQRSGEPLRGSSCFSTLPAALRGSGSARHSIVAGTLK